MEMPNTTLPAALSSGLLPPRRSSKSMTGNVTSKRVRRKAMMNSSHESVKDRQ